VRRGPDHAEGTTGLRVDVPLPVAAAGEALGRELSPAAALVGVLDPARAGLSCHARGAHEAPQRRPLARSRRYDDERQAEALERRLRLAALVEVEARLEGAVLAAGARVVSQQVLREGLHARVQVRDPLGDRAEVGLLGERDAEAAVRQRLDAEL